MSATSRDARAKRMASFCESLRDGSIHSSLPSSPSAARSTGMGDGLDNPKSTRMKLEYSASGIFCSFSMVWFILVVSQHRMVDQTRIPFLSPPLSLSLI